MKQQATQYLALDVHQATTVAAVRDDHGAIRMRATVPTEAKAIVALVKGISGPVHVAFEEGTQAQWLHDLLQPHAERVVVCNVRTDPAMQFSRKGDVLTIARITGPHHNLLELTLTQDVAAIPKFEFLPAVGGCSHPPLNGQDIVEAVREGIAAANEKFGTSYGVERIRVPADDTPSVDAYAFLASVIVERLQEG